jgi:hypothetical protein
MAAVRLGRGVRVTHAASDIDSVLVSQPEVPNETLPVVFRTEPKTQSQNVSRPFLPRKQSNVFAWKMHRDRFNTDRT